MGGEAAVEAAVGTVLELFLLRMFSYVSFRRNIASFFVLSSMFVVVKLVVISIG